MEVPIVSTDVDGVKEAVTHDREALLVPARDSAALAEGIERVLTDDALASRLVAAGRQKVETEFSFARRTRIVEDLYRRVLVGQL
jgi:glycosyltransferase involved in cell wall biosynthesis